jgi:hypothetical protein
MEDRRVGADGSAGGGGRMDRVAAGFRITGWVGEDSAERSAG